MIKGLGLAIMARKEELYELNYQTGATRKDGWIDIEGGAGTLFSFSSKGRRELPDAHVLLDGQLEPLSKSGTFVGQHIYTPLQGAAVHINAFNFPVWGMLEKLAPTLLAGVPAIVKPASVDRLSVRSRVPGDDRERPAAAGRGPADRRRRRRPVRPSDRAGRGQLHRLGLDRAQAALASRSCSARASGSSPSRTASTPRCSAPTRRRARRSSTCSSRKSSTEMTVKAGQKCTAIRRAMAPAEHLDAVEAAIRERLASDQGRRPARQGHAAWARWSRISQRDDVRAQIAKLDAAGARIVAGDPDADAGDRRRRLHGADPAAHRRSVEQRRGPRLSRRSGRSRPSCPTATWPTPSRSPIAAWAASRCRCSPIRPTPRASSSRAPPPITAGCWSSTATMPPESTGHGSPLPVLVHGGPGRAGGSEEMGGIRGVKHYMQRTAHPVDAGDDRRDHRAIYPRRAQARDRRPSRSAGG